MTLRPLSLSGRAAVHALALAVIASLEVRNV